jgi:plastocyanin
MLNKSPPLSGDPAKRWAVGVAALLIAMTCIDMAVAKTIRIEIRELAFLPPTATAQVGDTLEWVNDDFVAHTATARSGEWDIELQPKAIRHIELKRPGKVEYYCRFHPNMKGEVVVTPQ